MMTSQQMNAALRFLKTRLSDAHYAEVEKLITGGDDEDDGGGRTFSAITSDLALDKLPPRIRRQAIDAICDIAAARRASYEAMFPGAARIGVA